MDTQISPPRALGAYVLAVTCAATTFSIASCLWNYFTGAEVSVYFSVVGFVVTWILGAAGAALPYALAVGLANRRQLRQGYYFIGGAVATALISLPVFVYPNPWPHMLRMITVLALAGFAAGATCWACIGRNNEGAI